MSQKIPSRAKKLLHGIGGVAGVVAIIGIVIAFIQLFEQRIGGEIQMRTQATLVSVLEAQLNVQKALVTVQAGSDADPGRQAAALESTRAALNTIQAIAQATLQITPTPDAQKAGDISAARRDGKTPPKARRNSPNRVGNLITCAPPNPPTYAWIKLYRLNGDNQWHSVGKGIGAIHPTGYLKIDGLPVDESNFGGHGEPYRVELWVNDQLLKSTGNFQTGEPEFRILPEQDNYTPWRCPL